MSLRVLSESLTKVPIKEKQYIVTTMRELDEKMLASYNKMKSIREQVDNIHAQWKSLQEDLEGVTFARYVTNGTMKEQFQKAIDDLKLEYEDAKSTYLQYKEMKNKVLMEASDNTSSDEISYDYEDESDRPVRIDTDVEESTSESVNADTEEVIKELTHLLDSNNSEDLLDYMFNEFVPEYGYAETEVGELVRALMHILFTYKLSGHMFYQDQGISECASTAQYLMDKGYEQEILDIIESSDEYNYNEMVLDIINAIARDILSDESLLTKKNTVDSKTYNYQRIVELAPSFNYTVYFPYSVIEAIEQGSLKYSDVCEYVKNQLDMPNSVVTEDPYNDTTAVELVNLTKTLLDQVEDTMTEKDIFKGILDDIDVSKNVETNIETADIFDDEGSDEEVTESLEATNVSLTEDTDEKLQLFLELHDDKDNYDSNSYGFEKLYQLFDSYGFSENEDVDVCFMNLSEDDKDLALQFIRKH